MIVLSKTKHKRDHNPPKPWEVHPIAQWLDPERLAKGEPKGKRTKRLLLEIVADINNYLPDDWRMTSGSSNWRFKKQKDNEFRVEICIYKGEQTLLLRAALIGNSFREDESGKEVLHIVDTVFRPGMFSGPAAEAINSEEGYTVLGQNIDQGDIDRNPELVIANMYYFSPCPDDSPSPLFARQYEKIKREGSDVLITKQYHRIHPITKTGIDPDHFRWVEWTTTGNIRFVPEPRDGFRGKTYWGLPTLKKGNRLKKEEYSTFLEKQYNEEGITSAGSAPSVIKYDPHENEFKFLFSKSDGGEQFDSVCNRILTQIKSLEGFTFENEGRKEQTDTYMDDDSLSLLNVGACFRIRHHTDHNRVTIKKRFIREGRCIIYKRIEEEVVIRNEDISLLESGQPINALPYRLIAYVAPCCGKLISKAIVQNKRTIITIRNKHRQRAELCFDEMYFSTPKQESKIGPFYEVELESKGMPDDDLDCVVKQISDMTGLELVAESKYERAVDKLCL